MEEEVIEDQSSELTLNQQEEEIQASKYNSNRAKNRMNCVMIYAQEEVESEDEGGVFMDLSNMRETRELEVHTCTYMTCTCTLYMYI